MNLELIKQETDIARRLLALLKFPGDDTIDVVAALRKALKNIDDYCDAVEEEKDGIESAPTEIANNKPVTIHK